MEHYSTDPFWEQDKLDISWKAMDKASKTWKPDRNDISRSAMEAQKLRKVRSKQDNILTNPHHKSLPNQDSNQIDKASTWNEISYSPLPTAPTIQDDKDTPFTKNLKENSEESNPCTTLHGSSKWCAAEKLCLNNNKAATSQFRCPNCEGCMHTECYRNVKTHFCLLWWRDFVPSNPTSFSKQKFSPTPESNQMQKATTSNGIAYSPLPAAPKNQDDKDTQNNCS